MTSVETSIAQRNSLPKRRTLPLLAGLLLFELTGWSALYFELDRELGFGARFWGVVILAVAACLIVWFSLRALVTRRGWFTLKEFLVFVLLVGCGLGWAGHLYQQKHEQRAIAKILTDRGSGVSWGAGDEPGFRRLIGAEYFHGVSDVYADLTELTAEDFALFARLPELDHLQVYSFHDGGLGKRLTEDHLRHLEQVPSLRCLSLSDTEIIGSALAPLRGHPRLKSLIIRGATLDNDALTPLPRIPNLSWLTLGGLRLSDDALVHVGNCHQLKNLYLYRTAITDAGLIHLTGLPRLSVLDLNGTAVTDAGLAHLSKIESLTSLDLSSTAVTDAGMQHLLALKQLRVLELRETAVTAERVRKLESELPEVHVSR